jgi:hypothetical protein
LTSCKERILKVTFVTLNLSAAFTSCFKESLSLCRNPASTHLIAMVTFPPVCLGQQEWEVHGSDADSHLDLGFTFWPFLLRSAHMCVPTCILTCLSFCCRVQFVVWSSSSVRRAMLSKLQNLKMLFTCQETDYWWVKFITGRIRWVAYTTDICFMSVYLVFGYRWCINYWDYLKSNGIHQG